MLNDYDTIFATGVFLKPLKVAINGREQWRWIAVSFEDDSFFNGEYINPYTYAETKAGLIIPDEEDDEDCNKEIKAEIERAFNEIFV